MPTAMADGQKIKGNPHYYGSWDDPQAALIESCVVTDLSISSDP
jgi:hypothetical protein